MSAQFKPTLHIKPDSRSPQALEALRSPEMDISGNVIFPRLESYHSAAQPVAAPSSLESLKQEAAQHYDQGYAAGKREAEHVSAATVEMLQAALDQLTGSITTIQTNIEDSYKDSVLLCLGHLMPALSEHILTQQMANIILQASQDECGDTLCVGLHPSNISARDYLTASVTAQKLNLVIDLDPNQNAADIYFNWGESDVELNPSATAQACLDAIGASALIDASTDASTDTPNPPANPRDGDTL